MKKKRLLVLTQLPPPVHGVTVISSQLVDSDLLKSRFEMTVLPMRFSRSIEQIDKLDLGKLVTSIWIALRLAVKCVFNRPDLVYFTLTPTGRSFFRDLLYVIIIKLSRIKPAYHLHGVGVKKYASTSLRRFLYRWTFKKAWVIHLSELLYPDIEPFVPRANCRFLTNGIPDPVGDMPIMRDRGGRPIRILFLSHMVILKGPIVLMKALVRLRQQGVDFTATFAGGRFAPDCREQFDAILESSGLSSHVNYVGEVQGETKGRLLREADVFVFPSMYDAFGLVVLEAMAFSLPVIATRQGAIPDMIVDGDTGHLVPVNDPEAVADRLAILAADAGLRESMGNAARQRFNEQFTLDTFERNAVTILDECARHHPGYEK